MKAIMLNLEKINYTNYVKKETDTIEYTNLQQNIARSWSFLQQTHRLNVGECCCVRAVTEPLYKGDPGANNHEFIIFHFSNSEFEEYKKFITNHVRYKRVYNFYYNIFKIDIAAAKQTCEENGGGFFGKAGNTSTTNMIACDFDEMTHDEYVKMKEDFNTRGLHTLDVMSGHGYHIIFKIKEDLEDELVLKKLIRIMRELGYNADPVVKDPARVLRIPYLFNQKPQKYNKLSVLSEILDGEYSCPTYSISEVFEKLGFDYNTFELDEVVKSRKKAGRPKKQKTEEQTVVNENVNLEELYPNLNIDKLEPGIANMLKGFRKGYANIQTMVLTIYFKIKGYSLKDIQDILSTTEKINGNWNYWNVENEVERFYNNYKYLDKFLLEELEDVFGQILVDFNDYIKIPVGGNSKYTKLYIYLLLNNNCKKKDILRDLNISNNKLDRMMVNNDLVKLENRIYSIKEDVNFEKYITVDKSELEELNSLDSNEIAVYTYFKWKCGIKKFIKISIQTIKDNVDITEHTISDTIKKLEKRNLITVKRYKFTEHVNKKGEIEFYKESNEYTIL
jgi:hypothetical protein